MKITAKFIGANSLGYEHGKKYQLNVIEGNGCRISITRLDGTGKCPYESLKAFILNWGNIKVN